jgi:hypothetical protein
MFTQFLQHQRRTQPAVPVTQTLQGRLDAALALARRQMQDLQILLGRTLRLLRQQPVVGQPKAARREQVVAVAVVREGARLAHQPVDDVPVVDAMLAPAAQARQAFHLLLGVPDLDVVGVDAGLDPFADQTAGHRVGVAADVDRAAVIHPHRHAPAGVEPLRRQRPQHRPLFLKTLHPPPVALGEQRADKRLVVATAGEVPVAAQQQRLVQGAFEAVMALLHVAVLVRPGRVDGLALQAVVLQQALIALLKRVSLAAGRYGSGQRIGAMHLRHAAQFRQRVLQPGAETLEALGEAGRARLPVRVGQHEVVDQVRKRLTVDGDAQAGAVREVGGAQPAGLMHLGEEHFLGRSVQGPPLFEAPLQGAQLAVGEPARVLALQPGEQRLGFQAGVEGQQVLDLGPDVGEGIGPCSPGMVHAYLTGQPAEPAILAGGLVVDAGLGGGLSLGPTLMIEVVQTLDVPIRDHPKPPCRNGLRIRYGVPQTGKSNRRWRATGSVRDGKSDCRRAGIIVVVHQAMADFDVESDP